ncbi:MAG: thermosome subunit alpha [Nanoarchaeota archaeon]
MSKPLILMPEDIQRMIGKDAQRNNIAAAKMVAEVVKTTLGPKGMDKMLVSPTNEIIVTNDGVTILNEMQIEHPAAKMVAEVARTQESEIGDGTTSAVMIAGKLLENAEKLLDLKIHPTVIIKGYKLAAEKAQEILKEISFKLDNSQDNQDILKQIAMTAMTGKGAEDSKEKLAEIIIKAIRQLRGDNPIENLNLNNIKIIKVKGESIKDSELIYGIVLEKEKISHEMPSEIKTARIALVDVPLELKNPEIDTKISISSPEQLQAFLLQEEQTIKQMVKNIKDSGANVVFCQKGIDDFMQYLLAKNGIYACRRVARSDMEKLSKATGAKIISNLKELTPFEIGGAESVREVKHGENILTYVSGCNNPKALTILIHGGTEHVIDEVERAMKDGLGDVFCVLKSGLIVLGGGCVEVELSRRLRIFSQSLSGREKLAVEEFANALEFIPTTLAENAGLDPIDILTELKSLHDSGNINAGLNLFTNKIEDVLKARIIEPYNIKKQAIASASEVATMILRIDDVIASGGKKGNMKSAGEMPDYMGGLS